MSEVDLTAADAAWVMDNVLVHGIHDDPSFAYTAGLWRHDLPEMIVVGMNNQQAAILLNMYAALMRKRGAFKPGDIDIDLFTMPTKFGAVAEHEIAERMTRSFERHPAGGAVVQVLWPDRRGIFPDEPGFSTEFKDQKVLA